MQHVILLYKQNNNGEQVYTYNYGDFLEGDFIKNTSSGVLFKVRNVDEEQVTLVNGCYSVDSDEGEIDYTLIDENPIHNGDYSLMEVRSRSWTKKIKDGDEHNFVRIARRDIAKDYGIQKKRNACRGWVLDWTNFDNNPDCFRPKIKSKHVQAYLEIAFVKTSKNLIKSKFFGYRNGRAKFDGNDNYCLHFHQHQRERMEELEAVSKEMKNLMIKESENFYKKINKTTTEKL